MDKAKCKAKMKSTLAKIEGYNNKVASIKAKVSRLDDAISEVERKLWELKGTTVKDVYDLETMGEWSGQRRNDIVDIAGSDLSQ